jgi:hypothetical protein
MKEIMRPSYYVAVPFQSRAGEAIEIELADE